ncbi:MAG: protein translocase subunit SecF, partial [Bacteroidia bacterium]|nr:protein translocase subunit SecF [Bacteroidia bacterium]
ISMAVRGLSYGVDFKGGREYYVRFNKPIETSEIRSKLTQPLQSPPEVKTYGSANQVLIRTNYKVDKRDEKTAQEVENLVINSLKSSFPNTEPTILSSQLVGPTVARDITYSAFKSIFLSLIVVFTYLFIRFRRWTFSTGAVIALAHDVLMIFSVFSLLNGIVPFSLELDQAFIAAVLTIMGYSMNDTVVVFDRIREKLRNNPNIDERTNINQAINETLSRTLMTSILTLIAVIVLFFAGETLRGFNFALLIGIIVGTYSSIFIATPIVLDFGKKKSVVAEPVKSK